MSAAQVHDARRFEVFIVYGAPSTDLNDHGAQAMTWSAAFSPERTAPSINPCIAVARSVPAQWMRPAGSRSAGPKLVRTPGAKWAIMPPSDYSSAAQSVSRCALGDRALGPYRTANARSQMSRRSAGSRAVALTAWGPNI